MCFKSTFLSFCQNSFIFFMFTKPYYGKGFLSIIRQYFNRICYSNKITAILLELFDLSSLNFLFMKNLVINLPNILS